MSGKMSFLRVCSVELCFVWLITGNIGVVCEELCGNERSCYDDDSIFDERLVMRKSMG